MEPKGLLMGPYQTEKATAEQVAYLWQSFFFNKKRRSSKYSELQTPTVNEWNASIGPAEEIPDLGFIVGTSTKEDICIISIARKEVGCQFYIAAAEMVGDFALEKEIIFDIQEYAKSLFPDIQIENEVTLKPPNLGVSIISLPGVRAPVPIRSGDRFRLKVAYLVQRDKDDINRGYEETVDKLETKRLNVNPRKVREWRKKLKQPINKPLLDDIKAEIRRLEEGSGGKRRKAEDFF